jgi:tetratricopeptide (TPR) repeat protein
LGQAHLRLGQFVKSEQAFQAAIQLDPTAAKNYAGLGDLYLKQEQLDDAITQYKRATELLPQNTEFHHRLAGVYWDQQNYSQASLEYQTIIEQKPNGQACQRLGLIHLRQKKNTAAISLLKQSLKFAPDVARTHVALGVVYSRLGQRQEAKTQFKRVLQLDPTDRYANQMLNQLSRP